MRLATVKNQGPTAVVDERYAFMGKSLEQDGWLPQGASMIDLITRYDSIKEPMAKVINSGNKTDITPGDLFAPILRPSKIWAAASNYRRGSTNLEKGGGRGTAQEKSPDEILELIFLKPPSAIVGPDKEILIPKGAETVFPEIELCVVVGKEVRNLSINEAMEAVFGYTVILDMTARGYGTGKNQLATRCVRKGFDTFAPLGPWIATRDEIPDPQNLQMNLWVNGELRQSASTGGMVNSVKQLVSYLSHVSTLFPGDLIATGNPDAPAFQKQLGPGDKLEAEIKGIGTLNVSVKGGY